MYEPPRNTIRRAALASHISDMLRYLPASQPLKEKLPKKRIRVLAKHFKSKMNGEPKNTGISKAVGQRMIKAVAKSAAKRRAARG